MDEIAISQTCSRHESCSTHPGRVNAESAIRRRSHAARTAALAALFALASSLTACGRSTEDSPGTVSDEDGDGDSPPGEGGAPPQEVESPCDEASDCVPVSSTCCGCPSFAVAADGRYAEACQQVDCENEDVEVDCPMVETACIESQCQLICRAVTTPRVCATGFERDEFGCLIDVCRTEPPRSEFACDGDADCTQVQADCCGCERGGADTAVATAFVDEFIESLDCSSSPRCPDVNVCTAEFVPRCIAQACTLGPPDGGGGSDDGDDGNDDGDGGSPEEPGSLCGFPGRATCPPGQVCVLNHPDAGDATRVGVGTCRDA